jgi:hypothetical protein
VSTGIGVGEGEGKLIWVSVMLLVCSFDTCSIVHERVRPTCCVTRRV